MKTAVVDVGGGSGAFTPPASWTAVWRRGFVSTPGSVYPPEAPTLPPIWPARRAAITGFMRNIPDAGNI